MNSQIRTCVTFYITCMVLDSSIYAPTSLTNVKLVARAWDLVYYISSTIYELILAFYHAVLPFVIFFSAKFPIHSWTYLSQLVANAEHNINLVPSTDTFNPVQ